MLDTIQIVLVNTSHPGNIGAAARAMKTMGINQLVLVNPKLFPHVEATARASGASNILKHARVVKSLDDALQGTDLVIGTSARSRSFPWPTFTPRQCSEQLKNESQGSKVSILFGNEQSGLSNEELQRCNYHIIIPTVSEYSSLNLAAAVQVIVYELQESLGDVELSTKQLALATADEMKSFYQHLETTLVKINYLHPEKPKHLQQRLYRLFNRARLEKSEVQILRGILSAIDKKID